MDQIDYAILDILDQNGRATATEISKKVHLSIPAVSERIRNLEELNIIERYLLKINRKALDYTLLAFLFVTIDTAENIEIFRKTIVTYPEVLECHHITGEYDYILKILTTDTKELEYFISNKLKTIKGVQRSNTFISMLTLKEEMNRGIRP
ncbi:Lrp/AsnC family transcriptional regulator [Fervidibacillus albus]|uniref:Lrp/AsnC family transcriptional regulator n=1 Tax=Fervidibacillus albus TaxID=2980026 RepID=A0A9E8LTL9_9BACI|nr:Lrp/AsnC family transcriptional regulator [Fervidibacillus albus]WAA09398.1 Lrp/AsnC family transcriptional regulator [Fervidibacillus albus]